jgi:hypothetical protein
MDYELESIKFSQSSRSQEQEDQEVIKGTLVEKPEPQVVVDEESLTP